MFEVRAREESVLHPQRPEQPVLHRPSQWLAIDLLGDEAEQHVVGVVVFVGGTGREVGRVRERDGQHLLCGPDLGRVTVHAGREFGSIGVVVEAAAHLQQFGDRDVVAIGHARDVLRDRIVETELAFLGQLHDHRGRHRLGIRGDPEVGVGAGRARRAQLRGAGGDRELALGCAQEHHGAGHQELLGGRVHHGLQRSLVDRLERRRAGRGTRPRAPCDQESNTDQEARVGTYGKFKRHFTNDHCCWRTSFPLQWNSCLTMIRRTFALFHEQSFSLRQNPNESIEVMATQNNALLYVA